MINIKIRSKFCSHFEKSFQLFILYFFWLHNYRKVVENLPRGVHVNFLKAERSLHRWALEDLQRIHAAEESAAEEGGGVEMHVLEDAGHWVHLLLCACFNYLCFLLST